jgi:hypothetical protein
VSERSLQKGANYGFWVPAKALAGASGSLALERMQKKIAAAAIGGILSPPEKQNGNSGSHGGTNNALSKSAQFEKSVIE